MKTPIYKLTYFNLRARAEPIRFIFAYTRIPYEDIRIDRAKWPEYKQRFPWGQVPVLEIDGKMLAQSMTIARFLGRKYNLVGENEFEAAKCDEIGDALADTLLEWRKFFREVDPAKKEILKSEFLQNCLAKYLSKFDEISKGHENNFMIGNKITWAELTIAPILEFYQTTVEPKLLDNYPHLTKLKETVYNIPEIKEWIEKRPKTPM